MDSANSNSNGAVQDTGGDGLAHLGIRTPRQLQERVATLGATEYIIEGLVPRQAIGLVVGDSGLGKSPLLYQAALCVAAGIPFLDKAVRRGRVLYLDCENGAAQVSDIVAQLSKHLRLEPDAINELLLWNLNDCPDDLGDIGTHLSAMVMKAAPSLVILDPLNAIYRYIERDNTDASKALGSIREIMKKFACTLIGVHHPRKPEGESGENGSLDRANLTRWFDSARGPRVLVNGSDVRLGVDRPSSGGGDLVIRGFERVRGEIPAIRISRVNDEDGEPLGYNRVAGVNLLGNTASGDT